MKNKFLLFSPIFLFVLLIYLIYSQISFAAITSVTTDTPSIGKTSATLNGTIDIAGLTEAYDKRGFNLGTASASAGNYNMGSSTEAGSFTADGSFTHVTTTDLSKGTAYYSRAYAASSTAPQTAYGSEVVFLTGIDDPASLARTGVTQGAIDLSWTKGTGAGKTYLRYRTDQYPTSITNGTEGCISTGTSCSVSSLNCGSTYYFRAWSSTTAAALTTTSDSYTELTDMTVGCPATGGTGGRTLRAPTTYPDSLVINKGAESTKTREVELNLKADEALYMAISNDTLFLTPLENYSATKKWMLTENDGAKTVYIKFVSLDGMNSDIISDTIILQTPTASVPTLAPTTPTPLPESVPTPEVTPTPAPEPTSVQEKSISEMTKEELVAKITEILAQVEALKTQLAELKEVVVFEVNLKYGNRGDEVVKLQEVLIQEGLLDQGLASGWFGPLTKTAVIKFQEKYASDILTPNRLNKGTGFVGSSTRAKLNELLGK